MHPNALKNLPSGAARQGGAGPPLPRSAHLDIFFSSFIHVANSSATPFSHTSIYCRIDAYPGNHALPLPAPSLSLPHSSLLTPSPLLPSLLPLLHWRVGRPHLLCVCCVFDQIAMSARYCERLGMRIHWAWCVVRASPTYRQSRCRAAVRVAALVCERHRCNSAPLHHWTYIFTPRSHRPLADAFYPMCPPNEL